ncbi:hypothetical protein J8281_13770 [Aquimarina sp. U1-2]|uniref:hypothetical protein n=1 Tax=Aquimarina sp. U1-2 TaxID=2823141 RepID=UPI001AECC4B8|nr:hypothetical protein [Aquimarina sp. U1-2]MBP2833257.1 hypothetical protein [Aquimarina sp. U1-2]
MRLFLSTAGKMFGLIIFFLICLNSCKNNDASTEKYPNYIGYLDPETTISDINFEICGDEDIKGTHHGLPKHAYKPNKGVFDKTIRATYRNKGYTDSGYLNFRFIVNCRGETGRYEIVQMNLGLEETTLSEDMVNQLFQLTADKENWNGYRSKKSGINYYMYVSYKIEDGEISEILP